MGRRRIRNLKALGYTDIIGYDLVDYKKAKPDCWYTDMLDEVENFLENPTGEDKKVDGIIVSVPPLQKQEYIDLGNKYNVPVFCEADICLYSGNYYSSATLRHHVAIQKIKELLEYGTLGKVYTFSYHMGQHLRDWHPGADYSNYYAAQKESGACREMFCFELSWLSYLFGTPINCAGFVDKKLLDPDIKADDVFATSVKFKQNTFVEDSFGTYFNTPCLKGHIKEESITGTVLINILSRPALRNLRIVGEKCSLLWDWDEDNIQLEYPDGEISLIFYPKGQAFDGYNKNISEQMYIDELANWLEAVQGKVQYLYSCEDEKACIEMLKMLENSAK